MASNADHEARNHETARRLRDHLAARVTAATRREVRLATGLDPVELGIVEVDESELDSDTIVVCMPIGAAHTVRSHKEQCSRCRRQVWVSPATPPEPQRVCVVCFLDGRV